MKKVTVYTELAYIVGLLVLALGTALSEAGGFGMSMVVAPAYILHLKLSQTFPWFSFGMAEYVLQGVILLFMMLLLRKVKVTYFLSFLTAVLYGFMLDGAIALVALLPEIPNLLIYVVGVLLCTAGIALLVESYLPPEAYEMFVKEVCQRVNMKFSTFKTIYDCCSCVLAIGMSLIFFGGFRGIGVGSILCAVINGTLIGMFGKLFNRVFCFKDRFRARAAMEGAKD